MEFPLYMLKSRRGMKRGDDSKVNPNSLSQLATIKPCLKGVWKKKIKVLRANILVPPKETYKLPHRLIEKKRRDRINECIAQLKDLLPEHLKLTVSFFFIIIVILNSVLLKENLNSLVFAVARRR